MIPEILKTDRLGLRPFEFSDVADVMSYANDAEWAKFLPVPSPYTLHDAEMFLARSRLIDREIHPNWAIILERRVIGGINIRFSPDHKLGELGYSISRDCWSRGYATEVTRAVIDAAFSYVPELARIRSHADVRNVGSLRVMQKAGMTLEGRLRSNRLLRDELVDDEYYSVLRGEWTSGRA